MDKFQDSIITAISKIEENCKLMYQYKYNEGNQKIIDTISSILNVIDNIDLINNRSNSEIINLKSLNDFLLRAQEALENKDYVLYADILYYDISDIFKNLLVN